MVTVTLANALVADASKKTASVPAVDNFFISAPFEHRLAQVCNGSAMGLQWFCNESAMAYEP